MSVATPSLDRKPCRWWLPAVNASPVTCPVALMATVGLSPTERSDVRHGVGLCDGRTLIRPTLHTPLAPRGPAAPADLPLHRSISCSFVHCHQRRVHPGASEPVECVGRIDAHRVEYGRVGETEEGR
jgi:hypothetical protein